jgi:hypothetical protein
MLKTYIELKNESHPGDLVIRYEDFVVVARLNDGPTGCFFRVEAFYPVDPIDAGVPVDFDNLPLAPVGGWEPEKFDTEGEALYAAMLTLEHMKRHNEFYE